MLETNGAREIALARRALVSLRNTLRSEVGAGTSVHALHAAGFDSGQEMAPRLLASLGVDDPGSLSRSDFWASFSAFFSDRGWGSMEHESPHPGIGVLSCRDWAEADPDGGESQPTCQFTAGFLSSLLTQVAGGPVAVLEMECSSKGDDACRFAFGGEETVHRLYGALFEGASFEDALASV